jgi:hypothetical protein
MYSNCSGYACACCGMENIVGSRYECQECENYNTCETCDTENRQSRGHLSSHTAQLIKVPVAADSSELQSFYSSHSFHFSFL